MTLQTGFLGWDGADGLLGGLRVGRLPAGFLGRHKTERRGLLIRGDMGDAILGGRKKGECVDKAKKTSTKKQ